MLKQKKGQTTMMSVIGLIVLLGIAIITMVFIGVMAGRTYQTSQTQLLDIGETETATDETVTVLNATAVAASFNRWITLINVSTNYSVLIGETGNYTYNLEDGTITLINNESYNNTDWNLTYTFHNQSIYGRLTSGLGSSFQAYEDTGSFMPLIVLALVVILILSLIFGMMTFQNLKTGGNQGGVL